MKRSDYAAVAGALVGSILAGLYAPPAAEAVAGYFRGTFTVNSLVVAAGGALNMPEGAIQDSKIVSADVKADTLVAADIAAGAIGTSEAADGTLAPVDMTAAANTRTFKTEIENLAAGADISTRAFFRVPQACVVTSAYLVNKETASTGVDGSNTLVVLLANATGPATIATLTKTSDVTANSATSLGSLTNTSLAAGDIVTVAVTDGATADPGPFVVEVSCTVS